MSLTSPQEQGLAHIAAGAAISAAAQSAGVHRNSVHNWVRSVPEFRQSLAAAQEAKALFWREQAEQLVDEALATIQALMADPAIPAATRLKAALSILNYAITPPAPKLESVHKNAQSEPEHQPTAPQIVHNSAQPAPDSALPTLPLEPGDASAGYLRKYESSPLIQSSRQGEKTSTTTVSSIATTP